MEIGNTKEFATMLYKLLEYFRKITPVKEKEEQCRCIDEATGCDYYDTVVFCEPDTDKDIIQSGTTSPVTIEVFTGKASSFIKELYFNILNHPCDTNASILKVLFYHISGTLILPTGEQLIKANMINEAILLSELQKYVLFIERLKSDSILGEPTGIEEYREQLIIGNYSPVNNEQTTGEPQQNKPEQPKTLPKELDTDEAKALFQEITDLGYCTFDGNLYQWTGTPSLFGYFVDIVSDFLNVRPSNGRLPWRLFKPTFQCSDTDISTAKQAVNDYKNKNQSEPEGFLSIKNICK